LRLRSWIITVIAVIIILPIAAAGIFIASFNPNRYAPQIIAAVQQATGRTLTIGSPIQLKLSLTPTIEAGNLSLSNPPGFADPNFLTLQKVDAQFALLPLLSHRLDILNLVLTGPQFSLQTNKTGQSNWDFSTTSPAGGAAQPAAPAPPSAGGYQIALESAEIQDGLLTFKNPDGSTAWTLAIVDLTGTAASPSAPLNLKAAASYNNTAFTLAGTTGPVARFTGAGTGPWPVNLTLATAGATATIAGGISNPSTASGYDLTINATIPALEAMAPVIPPAYIPAGGLPPIHGITAAARIVDQKSTIPAIDNLSIKAGQSDLSAFRAGLALTSLDIEMASLDKPVSVNIAGTMAPSAGATQLTPLSLTGSFGPPQALFDPALLPSTMPPQTNYPVNLQAAAGPANATITGAIATPKKLSGVALAINAAIPDLSALSPLAGAPLPDFKNIQLQTTVTDPGGLGLRKAAGLDTLTLTMDNAAIGGDASLYFGPHPRLQAALSGQQINLDALLAAIPPPATPTPTTSPAPTPATTPAPTTVIPTQPLPFNLLKMADADIQLSADQLIFNKSAYTAIQLHAVVLNGKLTINPFTGQLPGGSVSLTGTADANATPPAVTLSLNAPALALSPFLKTFGLDNTAQGTMQARLNLAGSGNSPHDLAASLNGQIGLATVNGLIDGTVLDQVFGAALGAVGLPAKILGAQGPVAIRCFGLRIDSTAGVGTIRALALDSSRLQVQGGGTINFGPETLAVVLQPQLRIAGSPVSVPVQVGGTFATPTYSVATLGTVRAAASAATGLAATIVNQVGGSQTLLGNIASAVGLGTPDICPDALSLARLGQPGPAAPPPTNVSSGGIITPITNGPKNLLNSLFGK
jgi:AsmA protein